MCLFEFYALSLVETNWAYYLLSHRASTSHNRIRSGRVSGRFRQWYSSLGMWYLGGILYSYCWTYIDKKFQNASCRSSRYHQTRIHINKCQHSLPYASIYSFCPVYLFAKFLRTMLFLDNCFWSYIWDFNKLNS